MSAKTNPLGNVLWTVRKGGSPRQHDLAPAPPEWSALFPEFEIGAPVTQGGDQVLYQAQVKAGLAPCLLLFIESSEFSTPEHRARFLAGMAMVQAVTHSNLLSLLWIGEREDHVCLGYEAFSGDSLYNVLDHFTLDPPTIVGITGALGGALELIHRQGFWHRDLNPGWILLNRAGVAKMAGSGISLGLHGTDQEYSARLMRRPEYRRAYLAPEQVSPDGSSSDARTDIFALGAITYEMLVGNPPAGFAMAPSSRAQVGTFVDQVVFRALHANREARYPSAATFGADIQSIYSAHNNKHLLTRAAEEERLLREALRQKKWGWLPLLTGLSLILGGLGAAAWYYFKPAPAPPAATVDHRAEDAQSDQKLQNLATALSKNTDGLTKDQKEHLMAVAATLLRNMMDAAPGTRKTENGGVAAELLMQAGAEDISLETLMKLQAEAPPNSVDWRRVEALTQLMRGGRAGYQSATLAAERSRRAGDLKGERNELARAAGFLPGHTGLRAKTRANPYDPVPELQAVLNRMRGSRTGGPIQYSIRSRSLELHVDLSGNPRLTNITPLAGFPITHLDLSGTAVADLSPLARLPLQVLQVDRTPVTNLAPVTTSSLRLLTAEDCSITDAGSIDQSLVLANYRVTLRGGILQTKISEAHWGRPWVNSLGTPLQPIAATSPLLTATTETLERDFRIFASLGGSSDPKKARRASSLSLQPPIRQTITNPATQLTWSDAQGFCNWLTERERAAGQISVRAAYRLLTIREWRQAAGLYSANESSGSPLAGGAPPYQLTGNRPPAWPIQTPGLLPGLGWSRPRSSLRQLSGMGGLGNDILEWSQDAAPGSMVAVSRHLITDLLPGTALWTTGPRSPANLRTETETTADDTATDDLGFRVVLELPPVHAIEGTD